MGNRQEEVDMIDPTFGFEAQREKRWDAALQLHASSAHALQIEQIKQKTPPDQPTDFAKSQTAEIEKEQADNLAAKNLEDELPLLNSPTLPPLDHQAEFEPPPLPPPQSALSFHLQTVAKLEAVGLRKKQVEEEWLDFISFEMEELSHEALEKMKESAEKYNESWIWSTLRKVADCILSAINIIFGVTLVATGAGTLIGGLLIASGILSLVNLVCVETRAWDKFAEAVAGKDKALRNQLRAWIPGAIGIASGVIGAAGSIGAVLFASLNLAQKGILMANTAANMAANIAKMGEGITYSENLQIQADREFLLSRIDSVENDLERSVKSLEKSMESLNRNFRHARRFFEAVSQTSENILMRG
jgi:hypothetical protein